MIVMTRMPRLLPWILCAMSLATVAWGQPLPPPPAVPGQPAQTPGGPALPAGPAPVSGQAGAELIWRDVTILTVASGLGLTSQQIAAIVPQLEQLQAQITAGRTTRAQVWQQSSQPITTVVNAWLAGAEPEANARAQAMAAATQAQTSDEASEAAELRAREAFLALLAPEQLQLVETAEDAALRREAMAYYGGAPSLADYIVRQLDAQRTLMPDEYQMIRQATAAVITRKVPVPEGADTSQLHGAILALLDQIYGLADADYAAARPSLPDQVRQYLNITDDAAVKPVRYEDLGRWLRDPRTLAYLKILGTATEALPPGEEPAPDELQNALESARIVSLLNDLGISVQQANLLLAIAQQAATEVSTNDAMRMDVLSAVAQPLSGVLPYLVAARPVTAEANRLIVDTRARLDETRSALDAAMVPLVEAVRRQLTAQQASFVDWRVPPEVAGATDAFQQLREAEMLSDAAALAESLRMVNRTEFYGTRTERTEAFLEKYMEPEGPGFEGAVERVKEELVAVYRMSREQWEAEWFIVASRILRSAGLIRDTGWQPSDRPLDWYAIRDLLIAPQTVGVLQQMVQMRAAN